MQIHLAKLIPALVYSFLAIGALSAQAPPQPLNRAEILGRLALGQHPSAIARLVKTRGISFSSDGSYLLFVARAGGGNGILYDRIFSSSQTPSPAGVDSDPPFALLAKCAELLHSGETEGAETPCRAAIQESPRTPWPVLATLRAINNLARPDRLELARRAVELAPDLPLSHANLAQTMSAGPERNRESQLSRTQDLEDLSLAAGNYFIPTQFEVPRTMTSSGCDRELEARIFLTGQKDPELASTHFALSVFRFMCGDTGASLSEMREALRLEPDVPSLHKAMGYLLLQLEQTEPGIAEFRQAIACEPQGPASRMELVWIFFKLKREAEAEQELKEILARDSTNVQASTALADAYLKSRDRASAIVEFRRLLAALAAKPDFPGAASITYDISMRLGETLHETGDFAGAAGVFSDLLRSYPEDAGVHNDYGNALLSMNKLDEATFEFQEALRFDPQMSAALNNLGLCLARTRKFDGAIAEYRKALEANPNEPHTAVSLGLALAEKGDSAAAIAHYEALLRRNEQALQRSKGEESGELDPPDPDDQEAYVAPLDEVDHATAENNLGWLYATAPEQQLRNPKSALFHARRAVELLSHTESGSDQTAAFLDTLAEALLLNGQAKEALKTEEKALTLSPSNPELKSRIARFQAAATSSAANNGTATQKP